MFQSKCSKPCKRSELVHGAWGSWGWGVGGGGDLSSFSVSRTENWWGSKPQKYFAYLILRYYILANLESFSKGKYEERTQYQRTTIEEFCIFRIKSTLSAILSPFRMPDCIRHRFKFCHSLSRYQCYMLNADTSTPDVYWRISRRNLQGHLKQWHRNPDTLKGSCIMLNQSRDPPHISGSAHLCKLKNSQKSGELQPPREILPSSFVLVSYIFQFLFLKMFRGRKRIKLVYLAGNGSILHFTLFWT